MTGYQRTMTVAHAQPTERAKFIRKTYAHLAGAILFFILVESFLLQPEIAEPILRTFLSGQYSC